MHRRVTNTVNCKDGIQPRIFRTIYSMGFIFAISIALPVYINSSFLSIYAPEAVVGILYSIGSILTLLILAIMPRILNRFGNYRASLMFAALATAAMIGLSILHTFILITLIFIIYTTLTSLISFSFDIFLEHYSKETETGNIRGIFLTFFNVAFVIAPFIVGTILTDGDYWKIYLLSAGSMAILVGFLIHNFNTFKDPQYDHIPFLQTFLQVWRDKNIKNIFFCNMFLRLFFAWMVIYTPIYLHLHIGFPWSSIGIIFTIMLLPFILFEIPAGYLADTRFGEKEFLSIGFLIMGIATISLTFIQGESLIVWAAALFTTRIGASLVEIMTESYFFKHVGSANANIIGFFRNNRPLAYIIGPIVASGVLLFLDPRYLFAILGAIMLFGIYYSMQLKDTR